jgi:hypothetical protein
MSSRSTMEDQTLYSRGPRFLGLTAMDGAIRDSAASSIDDGSRSASTWLLNSMTRDKMPSTGAVGSTEREAGSARVGVRRGRLALFVSGDGPLGLPQHVVCSEPPASADTVDGLTQVTAPGHLVPVERAPQDRVPAQALAAQSTNFLAAQ